MTDNPALYEAIRDVNRPIHLDSPTAFVPACRLEDLGDASFRTDHRLRYAYVAGAMANGIGSVEVVEAMSRAGMLGFFGAAGLPPARVEAAIDRLSRSLGDAPHGFNLIHSPSEPDLENAVVDLYLRRGVRLVEASAYLDLTPALVRYRTHGIHADAAGRVVTPNRVIAKASRVEVASKFFAPPPDRILQELVRTGALTPEQARLAARVPVAQDLTAEADSGGHTDNRPLVTLLPTMLALRDRMQAQHRYDVAVARRGGGRHRHAGVGRGGVRDGGELRPDRLDQPGVRGVGVVGRGARDAGPGGAGRRHHGAGRRHVRDGRQGAGAEARHDVRHAGGQAV